MKTYIRPPSFLMHPPAYIFQYRCSAFIGLSVCAYQLTLTYNLSIAELFNAFACMAVRCTQVLQHVQPTWVWNHVHSTLLRIACIYRWSYTYFMYYACIVERCVVKGYAVLMNDARTWCYDVKRTGLRRNQSWWHGIRYTSRTLYFGTLHAL